MSENINTRIELLSAEKKEDLRRTLLPLSALQQRIWLGSISSSKTTYNVANAWWIHGPLNEHGLKIALDIAYNRHQALRLVVLQFGDDARQAYLPKGEFPHAVKDLTHLSLAEARDEAMRLGDDAARQSFQLKGEPLCSALLIKVARDEVLFVLILHHLLADMESISILLTCISEAYNGIPVGDKGQQETALSYREALVALETFDATRRAASLNFWRAALEALTHASLPYDHSVAVSHGSSGDRLPIQWERRWWKRVRNISSKVGVTPFAVITSVMGIVLCRLSGAEEVVMGTSVSQRSQVSAEGVIGLLTKTVPLRIQCKKGQSVKDVLVATQEFIVRAVEHTSAEIEEITSVVPSHSNQDPRLLRMALELHSGEEDLMLTGVDVVHQMLVPGGSKFDFTLQIAPRLHGTSAGFIEYSTEAFDEDTIKGMLNVAEAVLESVEDQPECDGWLLPVHPSGVRQSEVVGPLFATRETGKQTMLEGIFQQARATPSRVALRASDSRDPDITYEQLTVWSAALALRLKGDGAQEGDLVGLFPSRSTLDVVGILGIWLARCGVALLDREWPEHRLIAACRGARVTRGVGEVPPSLGLRCLAIRDDGQALPQSAAPLVEVSRGESVAYVLFTSGSTGEPKAVAVSQDSLSAFGEAMDNIVFQEFPEGARAAVNAPLTFDASFQSLQQLRRGAELLMISQACRQDAEQFVRFLVDNDVSLVDCTPTHLAALLAAGLLEKWGSESRTLLVGGEQMGESLWDDVRASPVRAFNLYGPTEFTVNATAARIGQCELECLGRPLGRTRLTIRDASGAIVPEGMVGEIWIEGPQIAVGYLGQPRLTAMQFLPGQKGSRCYATGDFGRIRRDGMVMFHGRRDSQVKVSGYRIDLQDIEAAIGKFIGIEKIGVGIAETGSASQIVAAVVGSSSECATVAKTAPSLLPRWMVPARYFPVTDLPRTSSGKLDRSAIARAAHADQTPESATVETRPLTGQERAIAAIFSELLGVDAVNATDSFFALGGHSLLATKLLRRIQQEFGATLKLSEIFSSPSVEEISRKIGDRNMRPSVESSVAILKGGSASPILVLVHPLGGGLSHYQVAVKHLSVRGGIWGVHSRGPTHNGGEPSRDEVIKQYLHDLEKAGLRGQFGILGWSMGAVIGMELAAKLEARDYDVAFLEIWDCDLRVGPKWQRADLLAMALRAIANTSDLQITSAAIQKLLPGHSVGDDAHVAHAYLQLLEPDVATLIAPQDLATSISRMEAQIAAFRDWQPPHLHCDIHALYASESLAAGSVVEEDWDKYTEGSVTQHIVPGADHYTLMQTPHVTLALETLQSRLDGQ